MLMSRCCSYWSGNDHFFKHWKNPVSAVTDCDGYLVLAQVRSVVSSGSFPRARVFIACTVQQAVAGHEPVHDWSQQSFHL